jgi:hypothetical protein
VSARSELKQERERGVGKVGGRHIKSRAHKATHTISLTSPLSAERLARLKIKSMKRVNTLKSTCLERLQDQGEEGAKAERSREVQGEGALLMLRSVRLFHRPYQPVSGLGAEALSE